MYRATRSDYATVEASEKKRLIIVCSKRVTKIRRRQSRRLAKAIDNDYVTVARGGDEYVSLAEAAIFEYAFRLVARLTMEVQSDTNE